MVSITLPDGNIKKYETPVTGTQIAKDIAPSLLKKALAIEINGEHKDLDIQITKDSNVKIITMDDNYALELIRHDSAHCMAMAVQELFPGTQVTIGPVIENGFYYDFAREEPFTEHDLEKIENKMREIIDQDPKTRREVWKRDQAIEHFKNIGEHYKAEIIESIPVEEELSIYYHGNNWHDLCRGPHLPSLGKIGKAFKLMKVAGAYWRGDSNNQMLQRIYGTCWKTKKDLDDYLKRIEEAEKRDHRKLGKSLDLFHFQEESPGAVFWHQKGWSLFQSLVNFMRDKQTKAGYLEVNTPEMLDKTLWEKSGHWEKFQEYMYTTDADEKTFAIKPMNCPGHIQVFNQGLKSYKDLPLKISEFGKVHRYEPSGALHGLMRVRAFTQDDAHIFCTEEQITEESLKVTNLILDIYKSFGFDDVKLKFSDRPEKRVGDDLIWDQSERALLDAIKASGLKYDINKGEGAFYGPKIEFVLIDAIGREWQCGTLQVDFNLPGRLGASYVANDGNKKVPVMLHRAMFGSLERFIGILIEHHAGKFPFWLAPDQIAVLPISSEQNDYAIKLKMLLEKKGLRTIIDNRNEKINYKIREHSVSKIPVLMICGSKEVQNNSITIRRLGQEHQQTISLEEAIEKFSSESIAPAI